MYSPGDPGEMDQLVEQAKELPDIKATRALVHDPSGGAEPHQAAELVGRVKEASGLPVGFYCQGAGGSGLADSLEAARAGADLIACAIYPLALSLHRVAGESLRPRSPGWGSTRESTSPACGRRRTSSTSTSATRSSRRTRLGSRCGQRSTTCRPGSSRRSTPTFARTPPVTACSRRSKSSRQIRRETGWPPLAAPIGQILASQALIHVLSARRYGTVVDEFRALVQGGFGRPPGSIDPTVERAVALALRTACRWTTIRPRAEDVRQEAEGLAASEEELVLIALFGDDAETLLRTIRARHTRDDSRLRRRSRRRESSGSASSSGSCRRAASPRSRSRTRGCASRCGGPTSARRPQRSRRSPRTTKSELPVLPAAARRPDPGRVADGRRLLPLAASRARRPSSRSATSSHPVRRSVCSRR